MKKIKLGAFLPSPGHHIAAWRHPLSKSNGGHDIDYYVGLCCKKLAKYYLVNGSVAKN